MTEEELQEDQWRIPTSDIFLERLPAPGFHRCHAALLEDYAQTAAIEVQFDLARVARYGRGSQPLLQHWSNIFEEGREILDAHVPGIWWLGTDQLVPHDGISRASAS